MNYFQKRKLQDGEDVFDHQLMVVYCSNGRNVMTTYYDDNFGHWNIESEEDVEFYHKVQKESVEKICAECGRKVRLRPDYSICNSCADKIERFGGY